MQITQRWKQTKNKTGFRSGRLEKGISRLIRISTIFLICSEEYYFSIGNIRENLTNLVYDLGYFLSKVHFRNILVKFTANNFLANFWQKTYHNYFMINFYFTVKFIILSTKKITIFRWKVLIFWINVSPRTNELKFKKFFFSVFLFE